MRSMLGDTALVEERNSRRPRLGQWRFGFSVIELLLVIVIVAVLTGIGFVSLRPPAPRLAANSFKALIQEARTEAIKRNRPVIVVWNEEFDLAQVGVVDDPSTLSVPECTADTIDLGALDVTEFRGVSASSTMEGRGLIWLPNGRHRACDALEAADSVTTFAEGTRTSRVMVSGGGRVVVQ